MSSSRVRGQAALAALREDTGARCADMLARSRRAGARHLGGGSGDVGGSVWIRTTRAQRYRVRETVLADTTGMVQPSIPKTAGNTTDTFLQCSPLYASIQLQLFRIFSV